MHSSALTIDPRQLEQQSSSVLSFKAVGVALFCGLVFTDLIFVTLFFTAVVETEASGVRFKRLVSGGNLSASQDGHNMRSPCVNLTVLLFTRFGQERSGKPSHSGISNGSPLFALDD